MGMVYMKLPFDELLKAVRDAVTDHRARGAIAEACKEAKAEEERARAGSLPLSPCPFCGGKVGFDCDPFDAHARDVGFNVKCGKCYLSMWAFKGQTPAQLAARWNGRA